MQTQKILQIVDLDLNTFIGNFQTLKNELHEIKRSLTQKPSEKLLTRKEVAKKLSITLVTLHEWTKRGDLTSYKIANRVYYKQLEVDNALTEIKHKRK